MILASTAKAYQGDMNDNSTRYNLRQVNKMIKAASNMGLNKIVLPWINTDIMNTLYDKGYRIYKTRTNISNEAYADKLVLYVVTWEHS